MRKVLLVLVSTVFPTLAIDATAQDHDRWYPEEELIQHLPNVADGDLRFLERSFQVSRDDDGVRGVLAVIGGVGLTCFGVGIYRESGDPFGIGQVTRVLGVVITGMGLGVTIGGIILILRADPPANPLPDPVPDAGMNWRAGLGFAL